MADLTVVLPALNTPWDIVDLKLVRLADALGATLNLVVQAHSPALNRSYFFSNRSTIDAESQFREAVSSWCKTLSQKLTDAGQSYTLNIVWEREVSKYLKSSPPNTGDMLVLVNTSSHLDQDFHTVIRQIRNPILVLYDQHWSSAVSMAAAVDPVHEDDVPMARDTAVLVWASHLAEALSGSVQLVHSCFVPAYLADFRKDILAHHHANIRDFIADGDFAAVDYILINGDPSVALRTYVKENHIAVLALGSIVRGLFDRPTIGSTTESFLSNLPCDLLLVHS